MLVRKLVFLCLFILFTGTLAQKYGNDRQNDDEEQDDEDLPQRKNQAKDTDQEQQSDNKNKLYNRLPERNLGNVQPSNNQPVVQGSIDSNRQPLNNPPVVKGPIDSNRQPSNEQSAARGGSIDSNRRSSSWTPLAASTQCKFDIQKFCNKGSQQLLSNLKVLQCVDDLDNVSYCFSN